MPEPVRTADGDLVERVDLFAADDPATPLQGGDMPGKPIRTGDGALVQRVAPYEVQGGVAVPVTKLGSDVGTDLSADPPLQMTDTGDGTGTISIDTDVAGGVPTLDTNTLLRLSQMPISGLTYHGAWDASTNTPTLADGSGTAGDFYRVSTAGTQDLGSGPITFEVGDHVIYEGTTWQQLDPAQVIDWGDIQGTLANQTDLNTALDAKANSGDVPAAANPSTQVGLTAVNGSAATYLRSDGAPALDQGISPAWTGAHDFTAGTIAVPTPTTDPQAASKSYVDAADVTAGGTAQWGGIGGTLSSQADLNTALGAKVAKAGDTMSGPLNMGSSKITNLGSPTAAADAATKAYVDNEIGGVPTGVAWGDITGTLASQGDLQVALDSNLDLTGGTLTGDLHMSEQHVVNIADGASARDAVNKQQLDTKADASDLTAHEAQQGVTGVHLPAGGTQGQVPIRGTGDTVAWDAPPSPPVQSVNGDTGAVVLAASDVGAIPSADEGQANGVATLDGSGKVPAAQLNVAGGFAYLGAWDASTNTPTLADGSGNNGDMYKVSVAGSQDLGSGTVAYEVGDHIVYVAGTLNQWERFTAAEAVASVAGKTGVVTLVKADVGLDQVDNTPDNAKPVSAAQQAALDTKLNTAGGTMSGNIDLGTNKAINLGAPTGAADAATKAYVDNHAANGAAAWGGITGTLSAQTDLNTALGAKADQTALDAHTGNTSNPHAVTKAQVGLDQVDNTADVDKPVSNPTAIAISSVQSQLTDHVGTVGQAGVHLPTGGTAGQIPVKGSGDTVAWQDAAAGGAAAWGSITGTLADQADLEQELGGKVDATDKATETDARNATIPSTCSLVRMPVRTSTRSPGAGCASADSLALAPSSVYAARSNRTLANLSAWPPSLCAQVLVR